MSLDPELVAETKGWFTKAAGDLRVAELLWQADPPAMDGVVYHCQQSVEKALKGFLAWHGQVFRKTHNLEEIGEQVLGIEPTLKAIVDRAVPLTEYAWRFRYPGEPQEPTRSESEESLDVAREAFEILLAHLPVEVRP